MIADHGNEYSSLRESFAGAIFLGSPLQGCNAASLAVWVQKVSGNNQPLLRALQSGSQELLSIARDFGSSYRRLPIVCFYERSDSKYGPILVRVSEISHQRGLSNFLKTVTSQSATILGQKRLYLDADHSKLNKFWGEKDENYQIFLPELKAIVSNAVDHQFHCRLRGCKTPVLNLMSSSL